ncbi:MAG: YeeE/YedE family protein [Gammaproteobacteria bacterium]|nr:YeeE/YedE family protein [Gammaproteobacteria bacterium]
MTDFTPYSAILGGALIGLAAALLLIFNGRIAGISGIVWNTITQTGWERAWRLFFLLGIVGGTYGWFLLSGETPPIRTGFSTLKLISAALLVGIGTRLGSGCTSGHGICGLARFSKRSLIAVVTFMFTTMLTAGVLRHAL